jgi:GNAT superfamily N-acetyltransferase
VTSEIEIRPAGAADAAALTDLAFEYLSWAVDRLREEYAVEWPPIRREDVGDSLDAYASGGVVTIAERSGVAVGMGAMRSVREGIVEIKRMFVRPQARGQRAGARILDHLLDEARSRGARLVLLDTVKFMAEAQRLYRARGFVEREPYEESEIPEPLREHWLFFERAL